MEGLLSMGPTQSSFFLQKAFLVRMHAFSVLKRMLKIRARGSVEKLSPESLGYQHCAKGAV